MRKKRLSRKELLLTLNGFDIDTLYSISQDLLDRELTASASESEYLQKMGNTVLAVIDKKEKALL